MSCSATHTIILLATTKKITKNMIFSANKKYSSCNQSETNGTITRENLIFITPTMTHNPKTVLIVLLFEKSLRVAALARTKETLSDYRMLRTSVIFFERFP